MCVRVWAGGGDSGWVDPSTHRSIDPSITSPPPIFLLSPGKTTTTERILYLAGATGHVGEVDTGDTIMDFLPQERERGITIQVRACMYVCLEG